MAEKTPTAEELQASLTAKEEENKTLRSENDALKKDIDTHVSEKTELQEKLNQATTIIGEQHAQLSAAESAPELGVILTIDKKKYRVVVPKFIVAGKEVTAADLKEDKVLQKQLVITGSSILEAV